jgi:hypothetical protein
MQIVIDTSKLAVPFKAVARGLKRARDKAAQVLLDAEARALLREAKRQAAVRARAMELEPSAFGEANGPKKPSTKERGTSRLRPAVQPLRRK